MSEGDAPRVGTEPANPRQWGNPRSAREAPRSPSPVGKSQRHWTFSTKMVFQNQFLTLLSTRQKFLGNKHASITRTFSCGFGMVVSWDSEPLPVRNRVHCHCLTLLQLPMQGAQVGSLVRELDPTCHNEDRRSYLP